MFQLGITKVCPMGWMLKKLMDRNQFELPKIKPSRSIPSVQKSMTGQ